MGGKTGESTTTMQIPEWLEGAFQPFIEQSLGDFSRFREAGMSKIMPPEGQTNVNVRNPWDIIDLGSQRRTPDQPPPPGGGNGDNGGGSSNGGSGGNYNRGGSNPRTEPGRVRNRP